MDKLNSLLKSRKFWAAVGGIVVVIVKAFAPDLPLSDEQLGGIVILLASYIIGTGLDPARA